MLVSSVFAWGQMPENSQILVLNLNWLDFVFIAKILITFQINWPFQFYDFILAVWFDISVVEWMDSILVSGNKFSYHTRRLSVNSTPNNR